MAYIDYQPQSAAQAVGNILQLAQIEDTRNQNRRNMVFEGIKAGGKVIGDVMGYQKRKAAIQYLGDDKLAEMKQQLAALKNELTSVENEMRTIKAEEIGSLDVEINADTTKPYDFTNANPVDYDTMPVDGGRTFPATVQPGLKALGGF